MPRFSPVAAVRGFGDRAGPAYRPPGFVRLHLVRLARACASPFGGSPVGGPSGRAEHRRKPPPGSASGELARHLPAPASANSVSQWFAFAAAGHGIAMVHFGDSLGSASLGGLRIEADDRPGWTVLELRGDLDQSTAVELHAHLDAAARRTTPPRVMLELTGLRFCDSSGLNTLACGWKQIINARGGQLLLLNPPLRLRDMLARTGLNGCFTIIAADAPADHRCGCGCEERAGEAGDAHSSPSAGYGAA
ncbi:STAS domain-containing protein [Spirillospora sp. NPDC050679]